MQTQQLSIERPERVGVSRRDKTRVEYEISGPHGSIIILFIILWWAQIVEPSIAVLKGRVKNMTEYRREDVKTI